MWHSFSPLLAKHYSEVEGNPPDSTRNEAPSSYPPEKPPSEVTPPARLISS